jgi:two-component system, LytTR family, sensor kinase
MKLSVFFKSAKLTFWHYQILGFSLYTLNHVGRYWELYTQSWRMVLSYLLSVLILLLLTLVLRKIYQKLYRLKLTPTFYILIISAVSTLCSFFWQEIRLTYDLFLSGADVTWLTLPRNREYLFMILINTYVPFVWSILYFGIKYWHDWQNEIERSKELHLQAVKSQLKMLRYQLNPHFLFNSLNSVQGLMYVDVKKADLMLTELSEFLRFSLKFNNEIFISLKEEFSIIEKYLFIEKIRFGERLNYRIHLPDEIADFKILCFLTQPLVENAVKHGMKGNNNSVTNVNIEAFREKYQIMIHIQNTGKWGGNENLTGTGIQNVKDRLLEAYSDKCSINVMNNNELVTIEIRIPYNE